VNTQQSAKGPACLSLAAFLLTSQIFVAASSNIPRFRPYGRYNKSHYKSAIFVFHRWPTYTASIASLPEHVWARSTCI